jgi:hypothetical protein
VGYNEAMTLSHENTLNPSADDDSSSEGLAIDNFVTRLNQLAEILGNQPVLTKEIKKRLGRDARYWASRGVDLSENSTSHAEASNLPLNELLQRNLEVLRKDYVGDSTYVIPPHIQEYLEMTALYLAKEGVDLLNAPDIDMDDVED